MTVRGENYRPPTGSFSWPPSLPESQIALLARAILVRHTNLISGISIGNRPLELVHHKLDGRHLRMGADARLIDLLGSLVGGLGSPSVDGLDAACEIADQFSEFKDHGGAIIAAGPTPFLCNSLVWMFSAPAPCLCPNLSHVRCISCHRKELPLCVNLWRDRLWM